MTTRLVRQLPPRIVTHTGRFGLMGEGLLVESDSAAVLDAAREAFGRFPDPGAVDDPLVVRLFVDPPGDGTGERPSDEGGRPGRPWAEPRYLADRHLFQVDLAGGGTATSDQRLGVAVGRVSAAVAADAPFLRQMVVEAMALSLLPARGHIAVHASCVVLHGVAVMLQAAAGTGKSTLAYAAARRGFVVLAEDVVFVRPSRGPGRPQLWGSPWRLHLLPDAPSLFPELAGLETHRQMNGEWKLEVDLASRSSAGVTPSASAGPQVILERGPGSGDAIRRLSPAEAAAAFEVLWPWGIPWDASREATARALRERGVYRVRMSGTPDEAVDLLEELVNRVLASEAGAG